MPKTKIFRSYSSTQLHTLILTSSDKRANFVYCKSVCEKSFHLSPITSSSSWVPSQLRLAVILANSSLSCATWNRLEVFCRVHSLIFCNHDFLFLPKFLFPSVLPYNLLYSSCRIKWPKYRVSQKKYTQFKPK